MLWKSALFVAKSNFPLFVLLVNHWSAYNIVTKNWIRDFLLAQDRRNVTNEFTVSSSAVFADLLHTLQMDRNLRGVRDQWGYGPPGWPSRERHQKWCPWRSMTSDRWLGLSSGSITVLLENMALISGQNTYGQFFKFYQNLCLFWEI